MKVGIVVATYLEQNQRYLDLCLQSYKNLTKVEGLEYELLVVSSGAYCPNTHGERHLHSTDRLHYPAAVNYGVNNLSDDCDHYLLLNDDTILTKSSIIELVKTVGENELVLCPMSNCDNGILYVASFDVPTMKDDQQVKSFNQKQYLYEDLAPYSDDLMMAKSNYPAAIMLSRKLHFYAVMIPKKVWTRVGPLDALFLTGQDDYDYCKRLDQHRIPYGIALSSLIWHFSGRTADFALTDSIRNSNIQYYRNKWGEYPVL